MQAGILAPLYTVAIGLSYQRVEHTRSRLCADSSKSANCCPECPEQQCSKVADRLWVTQSFVDGSWPELWKLHIHAGHQEPELTESFKLLFACLPRPQQFDFG